MRRLTIPAAVLAALLLAGGYGAHWSWTGINGRTATLWDWLHLLALPLASVVLALWLRHRPTLTPAARSAVIAIVAGFAAIVLAGYTVPWAWTGFTGNTLWDWLNLAMLPLAVVLIPVMVELRDLWERRHAVAAGTVLGVFAAVAAAGYLIPWRWTGFTGNTAWDWLHLLLLPLLVPIVIVPVIQSVATARMGIESEPIERQVDEDRSPAAAGQEPEPV